MSAEIKESQQDYLIALEFNEKIGMALDDNFPLCHLLWTYDEISNSWSDTQRVPIDLTVPNKVNDFLISCDTETRKLVTKPIRVAYRSLPLVDEIFEQGKNSPEYLEGTFITVGLIRNIDINILCEVNGIGRKGANFLKTAFKAKD